MSDLLRLRPEAVEWREVEGEVVVLDVERSMYFAVNRTGAALWSALAAGTTEEALAEDLAGAYDISRETALADVRKFLDELDDQALLERTA